MSFSQSVSTGPVLLMHAYQKLSGVSGLTNTLNSLCLGALLECWKLLLLCTPCTELPGTISSAANKATFFPYLSLEFLPKTFQGGSNYCNSNAWLVIVGMGPPCGFITPCRKHYSIIILRHHTLGYIHPRAKSWKAPVW